MNGNLVSSTATHIYWSSAPDCDSMNTVTVVKEMGTSKSIVESLLIKDQRGKVYWNNSINFRAGKCVNVELL